MRTKNIAFAFIIATGGFLQGTKGQEETAQNVPMKTEIFQTETVNATEYSIKYATFEEEGTLDDFFNATLSIQDYNISNLDASTGSGFWLGLGYGSQQLEGSDFTVCEYRFTNQTTDQFNCLDGKFENGNFTFNENQNITGVQTVNASMNFEINTGNFSVAFTRPFITNENQTGEDANLTAGVQVFYWAYGLIQNNEIIPPEDSIQGTVQLDLTPLPEEQLAVAEPIPPTDGGEQIPEGEGEPLPPTSQEEQSETRLGSNSNQLIISHLLVLMSILFYTLFD